MLIQLATLQRLVALIITVVLCAAASAAPLYNIVPLGLDDPEHTRNDGYKLSSANFLNEAGQVYGTSARYNGGGYLGQSVWLYDGATTIQVGLTGPEHTASSGYKSSQMRQSNEAGKIRGHSERYNGGSANLGRSDWLYDGLTTIHFGLTGPEHTRNDGYKYTESLQLNEAGQVFGYSLRYNSGSTDLGRSAWLYDGVTTIDIGFTGAEHTRNNGYKYSFVDLNTPTAFQLNEAGQVIGYSNRYNGGGTLLGWTAWLYDGATTIDIGLTGPEHTRNDGYKLSRAEQLNEAGQVAGYSVRFNGGSAHLGLTAWLYDGATTIGIGLTGPEHTRNDGYQSSRANFLNEAGHVIGYSQRYNGGSASLGLTVWLYDGATTIDIGLTGPEHTRSDGYKVSAVIRRNAVGQVLGYSQRYNGDGRPAHQVDRSLWSYNGATTIEIGLTDPEHTRNDGYKFSDLTPYGFSQNEAGQAIGYSNRYNGGSAGLGTSAWFFDGVTTINIGFTGPEYTFSEGSKVSQAYQLNEAGQVIGSSGGPLVGRTAWLYDGAATIQIGLTDPEHTRNDGSKDSFPQQLNGAGQVIGYSQRYNGGSTILGQDAWFYDPAPDQTFPLQLSVRSDGFAQTSVSYLGDDGLALGSYTLFDAMDNDLGHRAFYFTVADGLHDLGSLVEGGLAADGWDYLAYAIRANGMGQILGEGKLNDAAGSQMAYLLTPAIPEPSTFVLTAAAVGLCFARRHRTRTRTLAKFVPGTTENARAHNFNCFRRPLMKLFPLVHCPFCAVKPIIGTLAILSVLALVCATPAPAQFTILHSFTGGASNGAYPYGSLIQSGSNLYGMTSEGGTDIEFRGGTIFKIGVDGTGFGLLHSFAGYPSDGERPLGSLLQSGSTLYGMTQWGGSINYGTIFKIGDDGTGYGVLHSFTDGDGRAPEGSLIQSGSKLYGMTAEGGSGNRGTIFRVGTDGTGLTLLHSFPSYNGDGYEPGLGSLIQSGSTLYGMTQHGGSGGTGTVFQVETDGTGYSLLHSFAGGASANAHPYGSLIQSGSTLYGMTFFGGSGGAGTIFKVETDGTGFGLLHSFTGGASDGRNPLGSLIKSGPMLYGMTAGGGSNDGGTIFQISADGTGFSLLHSFAGGASDGASPAGSLIQSGSTLYGMTTYGGSGGAGTIFSLVLPDLPGDFNHDGTVDAADYIVWRKNPGGIYTQNDFNIWRAHFGQTTGRGSSATANAAVPEPSTFVLLIFALAGWCLRQSRTAFTVSKLIDA